MLVLILQQAQRMGIYDTVNQEQPVILTHVSPSLMPLLTGKISSVAAHGKSKTHVSFDSKGLDEYSGVEEDDICFEVNRLYRTLAPLHTSTANTASGVFNYAIVIGAHDLLGTSELQCAESDGLHVFRADGKPLEIDLNEVPFKLMIHQQDRCAFELLLTHQSAWSESIKTMTPTEKRQFFDSMIHEVPGRLYAKKGFQGTDLISYLNSPETLQSLIPNGRPGFPLSTRNGTKAMKTFQAQRYGLDSECAVRKPLIPNVQETNENLPKSSGFYAQLHNVTRALVAQAKVTSRLNQANSDTFKDFANQISNAQQRFTKKLTDLAKRENPPYGSRSIPHALSLVVNTDTSKLMPEAYVDSPNFSNMSDSERHRSRTAYEKELNSRRWDLSIPEPYVLPITDFPIIAAAPGLCISNAQDYTTEEGCTTLWSHLYWNVVNAPAPPPLPQTTSLAIESEDNKVVAKIEDVLGSLDYNAKQAISAGIAKNNRTEPTLDDIGGFNM